MDSIEKLAIFFRTVLGIPEDIRPDLMDVLRRAKFMKVIKDFRPGSADELRGAAATWVRKSKAILIAPDLWDKLKDGDDADLRFTVFHELGHAALNHADRNRKLVALLSLEIRSSWTKMRQIASPWPLPYPLPSLPR